MFSIRSWRLHQRGIACGLIVLSALVLSALPALAASRSTVDPASGQCEAYARWAGIQGTRKAFASIVWNVSAPMSYTSSDTYNGTYSGSQPVVSTSNCSGVNGWTSEASTWLYQSIGSSWVWCDGNFTASTAGGYAYASASCPTASTQLSTRNLHGHRIWVSGNPVDAPLSTTDVSRYP